MSYCLIINIIEDSHSLFSYTDYHFNVSPKLTSKYNWYYSSCRPIFFA
jgi:hypothetical protein